MTKKTQRIQLATFALCVEPYELLWLQACQQSREVGQNESWETLERIETCSFASQLITEGLSDTIQTYFLRPK